jgi:hypothetical protein
MAQNNGDFGAQKYQAVAKYLFLKRSLAKKL